MITVVHKKGQRSVAYGTDGGRTFEVLGSGYFCGKQKPTFKVPATRDNGELAANHLFLSLCPLPNGPCPVCIDKYMDGLGYMDTKDIWED